MNLGVIGFGNLGKSFVKGIVNKQALPKEKIYVAEKKAEARLYAGEELGVNTSSDAVDVVNKSDLIVLVVKPYQIEELLDEIRDLDIKGKVFVSFAAGTPLSKLREKLPPEARVFRAMPNVAIITGDGVIGLCPEAGAEPLPENMQRLFKALGTVIEMDEVLLDKITALSACGLAFVAEALNGFIAAGLEFGMTEDAAKKVAAQTFTGTVMTLLNEGISPDEFISMVATPGGATEQGMLSLKKAGAKEAFYEAIMASYCKTCKLG